VDKDGIGAVYFPIIATAVGNVKLQVEARTSIIADAVERELLIEVIIENYRVILCVQYSCVLPLYISFKFSDILG
jgi:hypothetical protein